MSTVVVLVAAVAAPLVYCMVGDWTRGVLVRLFGPLERVR